MMNTGCQSFLFSAAVNEAYPDARNLLAAFNSRPTIKLSQLTGMHFSNVFVSVALACVATITPSVVATQTDFSSAHELGSICNNVSFFFQKC